MAQAEAAKGNNGVREEPEGMEAEARLYEALAMVPSISKAWAHSTADGGLNLTVELSQRNLPANAQRKFQTMLAIAPEGPAKRPPLASFPVEVKDVVMRSVSPSGRRQLVVRKGGSAEAPTVLLELWADMRMQRELVVPATVHGPVYNDGWFGMGAAWSPDESRIAYVAEAPAESKTPEWCGPGSGAPKDAAGPKGWRGVGSYKEDWGELNTGKRPPALFVVEGGAGLGSATVARVMGLPEDASCGQPTWAPSGNMLLFTAWPHTAANFPRLGRRLGIVYCMNRPCGLYAVPLPPPPATATLSTPAPPAGPPSDASPPQVTAGPVAVALTEGCSSAMSPKMSPDGRTLVFLSHGAAVATGVHSATAMLCSKPWDPTASAEAAAKSSAAADIRTIVDVVPRSAQDAFPGLYASALSEQPFLDDSTLLMGSQWRSSTAILAVDLGSGAVSRVHDAEGCWSLLTVANGWVVACTSAPNSPARLKLARPSASKAGGPYDWEDVPLTDQATLPAPVTDALSKLEWEVLQVTPTTGPKDIPFEAIIYGSKSGGPRPGIVAPHGGPHSALPAAYFTPYAFLTALGYNLILVNYRGSTGFGEDSIQSLPGKIGEYDVGDCIDALDAAIAAGWVNKEKVAVSGGSHGGFLTGHLLGQHPDRFKAGVLRNPVMDISLMVHLSDIPDWCYIEAWGSQEGLRRANAKPSPEDFDRFFKVSPISHAHKVLAPMLFMLGAKDRRVPLTDGHRYVSALTARGNESAPATETIVFPEDTHALDRTQTEFEQWINIAAWLKRHGMTA